MSDKPMTIEDFSEKIINPMARRLLIEKYGLPAELVDRVGVKEIVRLIAEMDGE